MGMFRPRLGLWHLLPVPNRWLLCKDILKDREKVGNCRSLGVYVSGRPSIVSDKYSHPTLQPNAPDNDGTPVPLMSHVVQLELSSLASGSHRRLVARVGMYWGSKAQWEIGMLSLGS
jgi:hypothetical protein